MAQDSGSMIAASSSGISGGILWTREVGRQEHVFGHAAVGDDPLEAEDVVHLAHPVLARAAEAALVARHDLLGDHGLTLPHPEMLGCTSAELVHVAEELVPWDDRRLHVGVVPAPEHLGALPALAVARADPTGADPDHHLVWAGRRTRHLLDSVILRAVADDRRHPGVAACGHRSPAVRCLQYG